MFNFDSIEQFFISFGSLIAIAVPVIITAIYGVKKIIKSIKYENANGYNKKNNIEIAKNRKDIKEIKKDIKEIKKFVKSEVK